MQQAEQDLLVIAAQSGNHKAFNLLFLTYQKPLVGFAYKICGDQEMAKDAVQDSWMKSTKTLRRLKDPRAFKSWIYRLVRWRTTDLIRQKVSRKELDETDLDAQVETITPETSSDDTTELNNAINQLPPIEKQMIHLFYLDEMKLTEISAVLEIPKGTVKSRLNRARNLLKQKFE